MPGISSTSAGGYERYVRPLTDDDRDMRRRFRPLLDEIEDRQ